MSAVNVVTKRSEIDGKPIMWTVLAITGKIDGIENTLEIKLAKTEAMLAKILLGQQIVEGSNEDEKDNFLDSFNQ